LLSIVVPTAGVATAAAGLYLDTLAVASFFRRPGTSPVGDQTDPLSRLVVLIPAHNEADLLGRCLATLKDQSYSGERFSIVVIADNCTDATADIAASMGAQVLVRKDPGARGKGQALRWAMDQIVERPDAPDAVVVVDADSVADTHLLRGLAARLEAGAEVVQGEYLALTEDDSPASALRAAALLLFHRVRFSGRAALGMPCNLVGNGMLFSRRLLRDHPWSAFTSAEDLEYSIDLRLAGFRPVYAPEAGLRAPLPARGRAVSIQQLRWEGGRFHVVKTRLPKLVTAIVVAGRLDLLDAAIDLAVPPLGLLALTAVGGTAVAGLLAASGAVPAWVVVPWLIGSLSIPAFVLLGLASAGATAGTYRSLGSAPRFVARSLLTRARLLGGLRATTWQRTERPSDAASTRAPDLDEVDSSAGHSKSGNGASSS